MDDERGTVVGEDVFKEPVEENIPVHLLHRFPIIPGRWPDESVIRSFIPPVKEVGPESVFEAAK